MITNSLNAIRVHLGEAKRLSEQASSAFTQLDEGSQAVSPTLSRLAEDSYQASLDDEETDSSRAGQSAGQGLKALADQQQELGAGVATLNSTSDRLNEVLRAAQKEALQLGIPNVDSWFLRNAIESAETQGGSSSKSAQQIETELSSAQDDISRTQSSAGEVSRDQAGKNLSYAGDRLEDGVDDLEDSFREIGNHSGHGLGEQHQVAYYVDRALSFTDDLEREFGQTGALADISEIASPSEVGASPLPELPVFTPQPPPTIVLPSPQPPAEGFFKTPWRG